MEEQKIMSYQQTMDYIEGLQVYGSVPGLTNMIHLCEKLGNPQNDLKFVHIAGTNGKGSVLCFTSTILQKAGYRVGRYVSPTIFDYRERIQVSGRKMTKKDLCHYMSRMKKVCEELVSEKKPHPTPFEIETALAFLYFKEKNCDLVVLECGMGGAEDATNIVKNTLVATFTSISLDHMKVLGNTLQEIAGEKAGILKEGCVAVIGKQKEEALSVLVERCKEQQIPYQIVEQEQLKERKGSLLWQRFSYREHHGLEMTMIGKYQLDNAMTALETIEGLRKKGFSISEAAIQKGFAESSWPGRFEVIHKKPLFLADGAHNRDGAARLAESIQFYFTNRRIIYIIGILRDKEQEEILKATCFLADQILTVSTKGSRGLSALELAEKVRAFHTNVTSTDSVEEAVEMAFLMADPDTVIIAFGSLSYLGKLIDTVKQKE